MLAYLLHAPTQNMLRGLTRWHGSLTKLTIVKLSLVETSRLLVWHLPGDSEPGTHVSWLTPNV